MRKILMLLSAAAAMSAATPNFLTPRAYPVEGINFVVSGDFNGDGILDLAVSAYNSSVPSGDVQIMLGNGKGQFKALPPMTSINGPVSLVAADFNGDGKLDLAVAEPYSNTVAVLLGKGNGSFETPLTFTVSSSVSIAAGDINGDGHVDLAVTSGQSVLVFLGNGAGKFHQVDSYPTNGVAAQVALADLNNDGKMDLVYIGSPGIATRLGLGNGKFGAATNFGGDALGFALGDFNGDGFLDVASSYAGFVQIGLGTGSGTFSTGAGISLPFVGGISFLAAPEYITVADFNGDGHLDLAVGLLNEAAPQNLALVFGAGDGTFPTQTMLPEECPCALATGDFNGDHKVDLAMGNSLANTVSIALGNGNGTFPAPVVPDAAAMSVRGMAVADLNKDGNLDLITASGDAAPGQVIIQSGNGNGTFQSPLTVTLQGVPTGVAIADLNHDGVLDFVVTNQQFEGGGVWVFLGHPGGTYAKPVFYQTGNFPPAVSIGDVNGDGIPDLMVLGQQYHREIPSLFVLLGKGDGTFSPAQSFAEGTSPVAMATGDFNGDGRLDIAIADPGSAQLLMLWGNGDGTFAPPVTLANCNGARSVITGDFNKDGSPDLAVACYNDGQVLVLLGNGNGTFQPAAPYALTFPEGVTAADVNGDGVTDLVVLAGGAFTVLTGQANGTFQSAGTFNSTLGPLGVLSADFNNDGKPDLAIFGGWLGDEPTPVSLSIFTNISH